MRNEKQKGISSGTLKQENAYDNQYSNQKLKGKSASP
jgi:hypothetical protein